MTTPDHVIDRFDYDAEQAGLIAEIAVDDAQASEILACQYPKNHVHAALELRHRGIDVSAEQLEYLAELHGLPEHKGERLWYRHHLDGVLERFAQAGRLTWPAVYAQEAGVSLVEFYKQQAAGV